MRVRAIKAFLRHGDIVHAGQGLSCDPFEAAIRAQRHEVALSPASGTYRRRDLTADDWMRDLGPLLVLELPDDAVEVPVVRKRTRSR